MEKTVITTVQDTASMLWAYVPSLVGALAILVIGWVVARLLARGARAAVAKTNLVGRVSKTVMDIEPSDARNIEGWIGRSVFFILMMFVLIGFFQVLGLDQITQPITIFLNEFFEYLPRLIGPIILLLIAWVVAKFLRAATKRAMAATKIDERIKEDADLPSDTRGSISDTASEAIYWLTFLLFLPAILGSLELGGLLGPVRTVVDKLLGYLPNLLAAGLILSIGWLGARIVRKIVTNLLHAAGADEFGKKAELQSTLGEHKVSDLIGLIVYVLIFIPIIVSALNALELEAITQPASRMLDEFLLALPDLFAGTLLLIIAYIVAKVIGRFATGILAGIGFDALPTRLGMPTETTIKGKTLSEIVGLLLTVGIILFATIEALNLIGFETVADIVASFLFFAGHILLGLVILTAGLFFAKVVSDAIKDTKLPNSNLLALLARTAILILAAAMGLGEMGLGEDIITLAFALTLGAIAVALAIAFGFGGRDAAAQIVSKWSSNPDAEAGKKKTDS